MFLLAGEKFLFGDDDLEADISFDSFEGFF
jgi:hypothetical protein